MENACLNVINIKHVLMDSVTVLMVSKMLEEEFVFYNAHQEQLTRMEDVFKMVEILASVHMGKLMNLYLEDVLAELLKHGS